MKPRLENSISAVALAALPPLLYGWSASSWLAFLFHFLGVSGVFLLLIWRDSAKRFSFATAAVGVCMSLALFCLSFALLRSQHIGAPAAYVVAALLGQLAARSLSRSLLGESSASEAPWSTVERGVFLLSILGAYLFFRGPFSALGSDQGAALGFSYLSLTDVFGHMAAIAEVAKSIPPQNPYYSGEVLHYYWFAHVFPASFFELAGGTVSLFQLIQMCCFLYATLAMVLLAAFLRSVCGDSDRLWLGALLIALFASSFIWVLPAGAWLAHELTLLIPSLGLDRFFVEQGETYSGLSHGLLRDFVVEPHGVFGFCCFLSLFLIRRLRSPRSETAPFEGLLLGIAFGAECFIGLISILWWGGLWAAELILSGSERRPLIIRALKTGGALLAVLLVVVYFDLLGESKGTLSVVPYLRMIIAFPVVFLVEYGPIFPLAIFGLGALLQRSTRREYLDVIILLLVAAALMFFLKHNYVHNLVFRKFLRMLRLPLLVAAVLAVRRYLTSPRRLLLQRGGGILVALAIPSTLCDSINLSVADGSGRSVLVDKRDIRAYRWLGEHTPEDAVIQGRPDYGNKSNFSAAVIFANRRMADGDFIHARNYAIGDSAVERRSILLREVLFGDAPLPRVLEVIAELRITHIYVGPVERDYYGAGTEKFAAHPEWFRLMYEADGIRIYQVIRNESRGR